MTYAPLITRTWGGMRSLSKRAYAGLSMVQNCLQLEWACSAMFSSVIGKGKICTGTCVCPSAWAAFTASATLTGVLRAADSEHVGLLWDAHHTFATSNEDPEFTVRQLGPWIRHTHLKDSVGSGEDRKYVLTGRGTVPIPRQIQALQSIGYKGVYCFEWEKVWHPDLEDPEIAIADFSRVVGNCGGNAAKCSP